MTIKSDPTRTAPYTVVAFDICSSTIILEELLRTGNQDKWRNLIISLKETLVAEVEEKPFKIYKFVGDGWILLFDDDTYSASQLIRLLKRINAEYLDLFHRRIRKVLNVEIPIVGLTFGVDHGDLIRLVMNGRSEYLGRALNVASRLQGAVSGLPEGPASRLLISNSAYAHLKFGEKALTTGVIYPCQLRNISGGENFQARKLTIRESSDGPI